MFEPREQFTTGAGKYRLEARVVPMGNDLHVMIFGGDRPHIGAVAVAHVAADGNIHVEQIVIGSHREDVVVVPAAERIAAALHNSVNVSAGMHWDEIDAAGVETVLDNARLLVDAVIANRTGNGC